MKTLLKRIGIAVLVLFGALASASAMAQHYHRHYGYAYGGPVHFGISLGIPIYASGYYPAPIYGYPAFGYGAPVYEYRPLVVAPSEYVERAPAQAAPAPTQAQNDWYYCAASNAYYPYVKECAAGWQRVPAQPNTP